MIYLTMISIQDKYLYYNCLPVTILFVTIYQVSYSLQRALVIYLLTMVDNLVEHKQLMDKSVFITVELC